MGLYEVLPRPGPQVSKSLALREGFRYGAAPSNMRPWPSRRGLGRGVQPWFGCGHGREGGTVKTSQSGTAENQPVVKLVADVDDAWAERLRRRDGHGLRPQKQEAGSRNKCARWAGWAGRFVASSVRPASTGRRCGVTWRRPGSWCGSRGNRQLLPTLRRSQPVRHSPTRVRIQEPASEVFPDPEVAKPRVPSRCEAHRRTIEAALGLRRNAKSIWRELVDHLQR